MPNLTSNETLAAVVCGHTMRAAMWRRRVDKKVRGVTVAEAGDIVTMQFIPKINHNGTKNWRPVPGGQCFGVATKAQADAIKARKGLVGVLKMSETDTNDTRGVPRTIPVFDLETITVDGVTFNANVN